MEDSNNEKILKFCEFETKYRVDDSRRFLFKKIMEDDLDLRGEKFLYVQSGDEYFTLNLDKKINEYLKEQKNLDKKTGVLIKGFVADILDMPKFLRYRASEDKKVKQKELTFKKKYTKQNNIKRTELNLRVDPNNEETVEEFCKGIGYEHAFSVYKYCDIYYANDAVLVFYSVKDEKGKMDHFIEIEVNEKMKFTEEQGWEIIKKYEKILESLGIKAQNRIRKSLFEMYNPNK